MRQVFSSPRLENVEGIAKMLEDEGIEVRITHGRSYKGGWGGRRSYREGERIHDGVRDVKELHLERAELDYVFGLHGVELRLIQQSMLLELVANQSHREAAAVDRHVQIGKYEGQRANVVLMTMGEEDAADFVLVLKKESDVGDDHVNTEQFVVRKHHAGVDNDDGARAAEGHHVHAKFAQSAKGNNIKRLINHRS